MQVAIPIAANRAFSLAIVVHERLLLNTDSVEVNLDNLDFISADGLYGAFRIHKKAIEVLETNVKYSVTSICEPQLGKRGLYPLQSTKDTQEKVELMMNLIAYCDGSRDLLSVADIIEADYFLCLQKVNDLLDSGLMIKIDE